MESSGRVRGSTSAHRRAGSSCLAVLGALAILCAAATSAGTPVAAASSGSPGPAHATPAAQSARAPARGAGALARARRMLDRRERRALRGAHRRRGRRSPGAREAIVGGALTSITQVPWQVAVLSEFEEDDGEMNGLLCGGSIISPTEVLTAAHCVLEPGTHTPIPAGDLVVVGGVSELPPDEEEETVPPAQGRLLSAVRIHPYYDPTGPAGGADDVAMLDLSAPLEITAEVAPIALPDSSVPAPEGSTATMSGFGLENPTAGTVDGLLYSLSTSLGYSRACGGEADALFLCASTPAGSVCNGDSGGGLVSSSVPTLIGVIDTAALVGGQPCVRGALNGFASLAAPEIRDFVEGSEAPPPAPRGGGAVIRGIAVVGHALSCEAGSWSHEPTITYVFTFNGQVLQSGPSPTYVLSAADIGRTIACEVQATTPGGTGVGRTGALGQVEPVPAPSPPGAPAAPPAGGSTGPRAPTAPAGGTLGTSTSSVAAAEIKALLLGEITPAPGSARIATLLRAGALKLSFRAPEAGTAVIHWAELPPGARLARKAAPKAVLVALGALRFPTAGSGQMKLRLTPAGARILRHAKTVRLTAKGTFYPRGGSPISVTRTFVLAR